MNSLLAALKETSLTEYCGVSFVTVFSSAVQRKVELLLSPGCRLRRRHHCRRTTKIFNIAHNLFISSDFVHTYTQCSLGHLSY